MSRPSVDFSHHHKSSPHCTLLSFLRKIQTFQSLFRHTLTFISCSSISRVSPYILTQVSRANRKSTRSISAKMKFSLFAILAAVSAATVSAVPFPISTDKLNCRDKPSTSGKVVTTYGKSADVKITCQTYGETVNGNDIWDKTKEGCFVADYYIKTGVSGFLPGVAKCEGTKPPPKVPGPRRDDYKYKSSCGGVDPWRYFKCQCTSFVAQRINERLKVKFHNQYKGVNWGNANTWDDAARRTGVKVNGTPKPGAVAQTNAGSFGHVAWVSAVDGDYVIVEEYNHGGSERYGTRRVKKNQFNYIHLTSST